jgi:hypothetical protein
MTLQDVIAIGIAVAAFAILARKMWRGAGGSVGGCGSCTTPPQPRRPLIRIDDVGIPADARQDRPSH